MGVPLGLYEEEWEYYVFFRDFNVVREAAERFGSVFCPSSAISFNDFIEENGLIDVHMVGKRFTRVDKIRAKLSKLDRFLVSDGFFDKFNQLRTSFSVR